jgi:membrane protease YdiL (CAAX protease family)
VITAAVLFGLVHYYQGLPGILVTGFLGLVLCGLYVATGTLLVPIVVHALIDLRVALFPSLAKPLGSQP